MTKITPKDFSIISTQRHQLAEGPFWCGRTQTLYWVDIPACEIWCWNSSNEQPHCWRMPKKVSAVFTTDTDQLLVVLKDEVALFDPDTKTLQTLCELDTDRANNRSNDAGIAPDGSLWVGTMDDEEKQSSGRLWRIDTDGTKRCLLDNVGIANTFAWDRQRGVFYFADSMAASIYRFPYPEFTDTRPTHAAFVQLTDGSVPDGSAIDSAGNLWNAQWDGGKVVQYSPNGDVLSTLSLPMQRPTSCCFGGKDGQTLFITTASIGLSAKQIAAQPNAGQVIAVAVSESGQPGQLFSVPINR
ncbi:MAG: SMP-30/gluconolactonase/LRE family protein [Thiolinea sp.]